MLADQLLFNTYSPWKSNKGSNKQIFKPLRLEVIAAHASDEHQNISQSISNVILHKVIRILKVDCSAVLSSQIGAQHYKALIPSRKK